MRRVLVALAVIATGQAGAASSQATVEQPKIIVDGYGEVKTVPDVATITYTLRGEGATSDDAVRAMVASGQRIQSSLRNIDSSVEPKTSEVRVSAAKGNACKSEDYDSDEQLSKGACSVVGYIANQRVTVRTAIVKDSGTMVGLAARGGAYDVRISGFDLSDPRPAKAQAISIALADAQAKALALAAGGRVTLGPIVTISTVGDREAQDIVITGSRIPRANAGFATPVTVNMNAERITTGATVTVMYTIQR
jgi:uncharacterized protein YggE